MRVKSKRKYNKLNHPTYLSEVTRKNMVGKTKKQSPQRYRRKVNYRPKSFDGIDVDELFNTGELVVRVPVGDYICTVAYNGIFDELWRVVNAQNIPQITLQSCIKALQRSIDNADIQVDCQCPDWHYRFAFWATQYGYKYGKPETRPAKITNPKDNIGSMCKHLTCLLANKRWLVKLAVSLNSIIQNNYDELSDVMDMDGIIRLDRGQSAITHRIKYGASKVDKDEPEEKQDDTYLDDESEETEENEDDVSENETEETDELELDGD